MQLYRSIMAPIQNVRDLVSAAILDAAAAVIAEHGEATSMAEVAEAAGVGRATLYRYFASREELLRALTKAAINDASTRLVDADLEHVPVPEALARMTRALLVSGTKFIVIMDDPQHIDPEEVERRVGDPLRAVLSRGIEDGTIRQDFPVEFLAHLWGGMLVSTIRSMRELQIGVERASAAMSSVFLHGAESRLTSPTVA
jgi:TetR/AcrR family transcriptional repressor of mexCD-oprJ operon